jgi:hypothetical protein
MSKHLTIGPKNASKLLRRSKMSAFTLYGSRGSTNTDRVRLTLAEGGFTDYDFVPVNLMKGEQKVCIRNACVRRLYIADTDGYSPKNT